MGGRIEARLKELGIELPAAPPAAGNYVPWKRSGNQVFISGQLPKSADGNLLTGRVGSGGLEVEAGQEAAKRCALALVGQMKDACGGDLDRVRQILRLEGFVNAAPDFNDHPKVINGASDWLCEVFGQEVGAHSRFAVGCSSLPLGAAVEIGAVIEIEPAPSL
eukprot:gnl/TRDRNA2_/TRDRNA2_39216_c0_seq1.p1 gnl/TRDRNA2_/TRDRNA2_39216_c0~~gnl/TRDRNA2_/TRDRNA2_39216_c0_seq1.p1  ORF type:complete len:163 (+),score=31.28 gnl/TRDRNA2_/TRDRNA2_39216_c0_seq1:47-535(+)